MKALIALALKLARASLWPLYFLLLAFAARSAPWPRSLGILVSALLTALAIGFFVHDMLRWLVWSSANQERLLNIPAPVARQLYQAGRFLLLAALFSLLPVYLFDHELIAPEGRPFTAPSLARLLVVACELLLWGSCAGCCLEGRPCSSGWRPRAHRSTKQRHPRPPPQFHFRLRHRAAACRCEFTRDWIGSAVTGGPLPRLCSRRWRRSSFWMSAAIALPRRLAAGGSQTLLAVACAVVAYRAIARAIDRNAWRWARPGHSWAMALTTAVAFRASARSRAASGGLTAVTADSADPGEAADDSVPLEDLAAGLQRLCSYATIVLFLLLTAWIWDLDLALVRFILAQPIWSADGQVAVTVGNVTEAAVFILLGALSWRYMNTLFAVTIFPRMPDDPGVRFAVVTLCRYAVLGLTSLVALSAVHLDLAKIGVVLAAPGRRPRLRSAGNRLQLCLRNHPPAGAAHPHRRRCHRRRHHRKGRPDQHPGHDDRQRRQPEHDRPQPRIHHGQSGQLDAQGQDPASRDQAERRLWNRPRPSR